MVPKLNMRMGPPPLVFPRLTQRDGLAVLLVRAYPGPGTAALLRVCQERKELVIKDGP